MLRVGFFTNFGKERVGKILFIDNNHRFTKFFTYFEIHSLKTKTKSLVDDEQLSKYFNTTFPVGHRDNHFPVIQAYL